MKIFIVVDTPGWAIDHLAQWKIKYNKHIKFKCVYVHPRDAGNKNIQDIFKKQLDDFKPDIIHFEYFRSCSQLLEAIPELKKYKIILTHHNQRNKALGYKDWLNIGVDYIVTHTKKCKSLLVNEYKQDESKVFVINHGIDLDEFEYNDKEPETKIIGYVGRIVPWKGLKEIAQCAKELGYRVQVMGKQDKADYWNEILKENLQDVMDFSYMDCSDEDRIAAYNNMLIYVGNSTDGYEEGTMPYLEAMASGVPVITTPNGVANDIAKDRDNCMLVPFDNKEKLKEAIKELIEDKELRSKLRNGGWETVKNMPYQKMAKEYSKLYYQLKDEKKLVSIIIPTTLSRFELLGKTLKSIENQTYNNIEVIIAFDEGKKVDDELKNNLRSAFDIPLKFVDTESNGYNLAKARNLATIESEGKYLLFLDSRFELDEQAVLLFVEAIKQTSEKIWLFGNKGANKKAFVENFSFVRKGDFVKFGMMPQYIQKYGALSQELRTRWQAQGNNFVYLEGVLTKQLIKSGKDLKKRKDIIASKYLLYKLYN